MSDHIPVLLNELVESVVTDIEGTYVDATYGRGGHSRALLESLGSKGRLIGCDRDPANSESAHVLALSDSRFTFVQTRFTELNQSLSSLGVEDITGILFDVGVSTPQLTDASRGFAFDLEGPLDMRMSNKGGESAAAWINRAKIQELADVLRTYGEVDAAYSLAKQIHLKRPLRTTLDLVNVVKSRMGGNRTTARQLAQVFQAIRIHINDELNQLEEGLRQAFDALRSGGRLGVITFHSLEHRLARQRLQEWVRPSTPKGLPIRDELARAKFVLKNCRPSYLERQRNPKSRSAMLQVIEKVK